MRGAEREEVIVRFDGLNKRGGGLFYQRFLQILASK